MPTGTKIRENEKELARALLAMGRSYREVAEAMELSVGSIHNIAREPVERIEPVVREIRRRFAMKHWMLADHVLNTITRHDLSHASLKEKAIASAILTDKAITLEKTIKSAGPPAMPGEGHVVVLPQTMRVGLASEQQVNTGPEAKAPFKPQFPPPPRD
jgi:hypothetical protein